MKVDDLLGRYKPAERSVTVLLDGSIRAAIDETRQRLKQARRTEKVDGLASQAPQIEAALQKLEKQADEATISLVLSALPGSEFTALVHAHPPTQDDWDAFREIQKQNPLFARAPEYSLESFAPALIGLSISQVDGEAVDWSAADGQQLWDTLHDGARADLWDVALGVNIGRSERPLLKTATGETPDSGSGSTTPPNEESDTPSS